MTLTIPTIRLTGTLLDATGHPVRQYVTLTPSFSVLRDVGDLSTVIPSRVQVLPDNAGHFAVDLLATNYPGVDPRNWAWRMVIPGGPTYNIPLDYATPGGALDLIDILSATASATSQTIVWDRRITDSIDYDKTVAPTDGQAITWNGASGKYAPGAIVASSTPQALTASGGVITPNASAGSVFRHTATADVTLASPTGGFDGQMIYVEVFASGGSRTLTYGTGSTVIPSGTWWVGQMIYHFSGTLWVLL